MLGLLIAGRSAMLALMMVSCGWCAQAPLLDCAQREIDLGHVNGTTAYGVFFITNRGDAPLTINRVRTCCGARCSLTPMTIRPTGIVEAVIEVDLRSSTGAWRKTTYVLTNDLLQPVVTLRLKGVTDAPAQPLALDTSAVDRPDGGRTP